MLEFIDDCLNSLSNTNRWATYDTLEENSVAEHSFLVAHIGYYIAFNTKNCDEDEVIRRALFHDMEEAYTGDIPRFSKRSSESFAKELSKIEEKAVDEMLEDLPKEFRKEVKNTWSNCKDASIEGKTLAQADILATVYEMYIEKLKGNKKLMNNEDVEKGIEYAKEACSNSKIAKKLLEDMLDSINH